MPRRDGPAKDERPGRDRYKRSQANRSPDHADNAVNCGKRLADMDGRNIRKALGNRLR